jgi:hypothetical protein
MVLFLPRRAADRKWAGPCGDLTRSSQVRDYIMANRGHRLRFARWWALRGATPVACGKGLPGQCFMAQNSPEDGHGEHRNSSLRVRRSGRRCDGSQVNR